MRKIDLEAHFYTEEYNKYFRGRKEFPKLETIEDEKRRKIDRIWYSPDLARPKHPSISERLLDLEETRLKEMDEAGIDMQVLSLNEPGCQLFDTAEATALVKKTNDELARVIKNTLTDLSDWLPLPLRTQSKPLMNSSEPSKNSVSEAPGWVQTLGVNTLMTRSTGLYLRGRKSSVCQ